MREGGREGGGMYEGGRGGGCVCVYMYICVCLCGRGGREDRRGQDRRGQDRRGMSKCACRGGRGENVPLYVCSMAAQLKICS